MNDLEKELKSAITLATNLLKKLCSENDWGSAEKEKLNILAKITTLLEKLSKVEIPLNDEAEIAPEKDKEIIERFIKRHNERIAENNQPDIAE